MWSPYFDDDEDGFYPNEERDLLLTEDDPMLPTSGCDDLGMEFLTMDFPCVENDGNFNYILPNVLPVKEVSWACFREVEPGGDTADTRWEAEIREEKPEETIAPKEKDARAREGTTARKRPVGGTLGTTIETVAKKVNKKVAGAKKERAVVKAKKKTAGPRLKTWKKTEKVAGAKKERPAVKAKKAKKAHICKHCSKVFTQKSNLSRHIRIVHREVRVQCPHCDTNFTRTDSLPDHLQRFHPQEKGCLEF